MGKLVKKYSLAFLLAVGLAAAAVAANTVFTDVKVRNLTVTGTQTNTGAVADSGNHTVTGNLAVTGTTTLTGAVTQSSTTFTGAILPWPRTLAQINALLSGTTGQIVICSDCTRTGICQSTGTVTAGAWVVPVSTAASPSYTTLHCQ